ncbi:MAG TPA: RDD family protein [Methylibium sp.]|uniref:RDD family protein n=1 Tax=Methylibium sp. TaxID=2067992 RepID=UPI002DBB8A4A|nr:RDD family protein [Methylibium sp.]HEU4460324.1 RDD family protein [Methylibium sp.]
MTTPERRPAEAAGALAIRTPPLKRRMACLIYEGVLLFGVVFLAALIYGVSTGQRHALGGRQGLGVFAFVLVPAVYFIGYWLKTGQTLPMQTWQIRLDAAGGGRVGLGRATARFIVAWAWVLPPLLLAAWIGAAGWRASMVAGVVWLAVYAASSRLHPSGQFWHDLACGTRLVDTRAETAA